MPSFKLLTAFALSVVGAASAAILPARQTSCFPPTPGNYNFIFADRNEIVGVSGLSDVPFLATTDTVPEGNLGVWSLTMADNAGFHIHNVQLGRNVTTKHLNESGLNIVLVAEAGTQAETYAIECAGEGRYVIKAVTQDALWTMVSVLSGAPEDLSYVQSLPASGSGTQQFFLQQV